MTAQCRQYNSLYWDPHTQGIDALTQSDWRTQNNFVTPPFRLLSRTLDVIEEQGAVATVIAPLWKGQPWFLRLKAMSVSHPIPLPNLSHVFKSVVPGTMVEPLRNKNWKMFAWRICGNKDYRN